MPLLTSSGAPTFNGDSSCTIDSTDVLQAPPTFLTTDQGWFAARVVPSWAAATPPTSPRLFDAQTGGAVTRVAGIFSAGNWDLQYASASVVDNLNAGSHVAGDHLTLILKWKTNGTTGSVKQSLNGAAFNTGSAITTASVAPDTFTIGNRAAADRPFTGNYHWVIVGTGDPTDADASTINGFGDTDPALEAIPASPTFLWYATDLNYFATNTAFAPRRMPLGV